MDFEKAYQNFINGTATAEETEFVRSEMKKANDINGILESVKKEGATNDAEQKTVKTAIKKYRKRDTVKILTIVCSAILVVAIGIGCAIGIPILSNAKDNTRFTVQDAKDIATDYLAEKYPDGASAIKVYSVEKELEVEGRIKNARYVYVVEIYNGVNRTFEIEIDSKTGNIIEVDD